jgi:hypothetical protein
MMGFRPVRLIWETIVLIVVITAVAWGLSFIIPLLFSLITSPENAFIKIMATALAMGALSSLVFAIIKFTMKRANKLVEDIKGIERRVVEPRTRKSFLICWLSYPKRDILVPRDARGSVAKKLIEIFRNRMPMLALLAIPSVENPEGGISGSGWKTKLGEVGVEDFYDMSIVINPVVASKGPRASEGYEGEVRVEGVERARRT